MIRMPTDLSALVKLGLGRSFASLLIKVATAGLTYGMYVVLSRGMGATEYGYFAFGLSLATVLSIGAAMGQQTAILRYWPEDHVAKAPERARLALGAGGALVLIAGLVISAALIAGAVAWGWVGGAPVVHVVAAAALVLPMALAEYWSSALRAQGSVWTALAPRDLGWRFVTPALAILGFGAGLSLSGWAALLLTAIVLALCLGAQALLAERRGYLIRPGFRGLRTYWRERGGASRWFLAGTLIDSAALNLDTIFVGMLLAPAAAGIYFNAFRTAGLMTLFMFAITLVVAPMLAQYYHAGDMRRAQAITALCAWAGFLFSLLVFVLFVAFGGPVLSLFGDHAEAGYWVLVILSIGLLADAATGASRIVMMMTGHERDYVRIFGLVMAVGLVVEVAAIPVFGLIGAALVNTGARIAAQVAIAWWCRRHIGLDPSLFGILALRKMPAA